MRVPQQFTFVSSKLQGRRQSLVRLVEYSLNHTLVLNNAFVAQHVGFYTTPFGPGKAGDALWTLPSAGGTPDAR